MGQFLAPKGQILPATVADVKSRLRRVEHKIEAVQAKGTDTGGIEVTFSDTLPDKAAAGDVWYKTSGSSVIAQYQCVSGYASGKGVQADWSAYTVDGGTITPSTVSTPQLAPQAVTAGVMAPAAVTLSAVDTASVTARALGSTVTTVSTTQPTGSLAGDTWVETDGTGAVIAIWTTADGTTWTEATIAISTAGGTRITASTTAPANPNSGDIWVNESSGNAMEQYNGSTWVTYQFGAGAIANAAVDTAQLSSAVNSTISTASSNASSALTTANTANTTAGTALTTAQSKTKVTISATAPSSPSTGDIWTKLDSNGNQIGSYEYAAGSWSLNTAIDASAMVAAGTITTNQLSASAVTAGQIDAGALDSMTINSAVINSATINGSDFIIQPGVSNAVLAYNTLTPQPWAATFNDLGVMSWTSPVTGTAIIECWGAGGGGGGGGVSSSTNYGGGGAGGGGEYASQTVPVTAGTKYTGSIGGGGAGGTAEYPPNASGEAGSAGASTTFTVGSTTITAHGGGGGTGGMFGAAPGAGGKGSTNTVHYNGGQGGSNGGGPNGGGGGSSGGPSSAGNPGANATSSAGGNGAAAVTSGGQGSHGWAYTPAGGTDAGVPGGGGGGGAGYMNAAGDVYELYGIDGGNGQIRITCQAAASTTPALVASMAGTTGNDSYGNALEDGFTSYYGQAMGQLHVNQANGVPALEMYTGASSEKSHASLYTLVGNAGTSSESMITWLYGAASTSDSVQSAIALCTNTKTAGGFNPEIYFVCGSTSMTLDQSGFHAGQIQASSSASSPTLITTDTWHSLSVPSGWSGYIRYKLTIQNTVFVQWEVSGGNATLNWTIATLPAGYCPARDFKTAAGVYATASSNQIIRCNITTGGAITALGSGLTINEFDGFAEVPLD